MDFVTQKGLSFFTGQELDEEIRRRRAFLVEAEDMVTYRQSAEDLLKQVRGWAQVSARSTGAHSPFYRQVEEIAALLKAVNGLIDLEGRLIVRPQQVEVAA